jgi:4-hydroxy 2-oxovalerate aldolase
MKILDCTLRDGGYYTNWDFDRRVVKTYLKSFNSLPVDYLEVGYRNPTQIGYKGEYYYCPPSTLNFLKRNTDKKLAIILNEKDVRLEMIDSLLNPCLGVVDMIRMAVDPINFKRALSLAKAVKSKGFEVAFNVMYMSRWDDYPEMMSDLKYMDGIVDYFYLVDSFGGVFPNDVTNTVIKVRSLSNVKIGFHGHNNLEMALANTIAAIEAKVDIVDATITGMGRGAGNLKTELLLTVLNQQPKFDVDFNSLSEVTAVFQDLQDVYKWGTSLPYMVSGSNSLPQKDVMEWSTKRFFSFNSIIQALSNRSKGIADNLKLPIIDFGLEKKFPKVLVIGGGPSVIKHKESIEKFIEINSDMAVVFASSKNSRYLTCMSETRYYCLVGNEGHRLEKTVKFENIEKIKCVLPPYPRTMGTYIPSALINNSYELESIKVCDRYQNSHTVLALETAISLGASKIYAVGYDGYSNVNTGKKEQDLFKENEYIFNQFSKSHFSIISLLESDYESMSKNSLFNLIDC